MVRLVAITVLTALACHAAHAQHGMPFITGQAPAELEELSGAVASRTQHGVFWAHNDSGDEPRIYAIDSTGTLLAKHLLGGTAKAVDWEDITIRQHDGRWELVIGDIGDNSARRRNITLYYVAEPRASGNDTLAARSQTLVYPDSARDAETLIADPLTGALYIVSKREFRNRVYRVPEPSGNAVDTLVYICTLPFGMSVAGDISPDGMDILIKTYARMYHWHRGNPTEPLASLLATPCTIERYMPEPQGETVAYAWHGDGYYTMGEAEAHGIRQNIYYYPRMHVGIGHPILPDPTIPQVTVRPDSADMYKVSYMISTPDPVNVTLHNAFMFKLADVATNVTESGHREHALDMRKAPDGEYVVVVRSGSFYASAAFTVAR